MVSTPQSTPIVGRLILFLRYSTDHLDELAYDVEQMSLASECDINAVSRIGCHCKSSYLAPGSTVMERKPSSFSISHT